MPVPEVRVGLLGVTWECYYLSFFFFLNKMCCVKIHRNFHNVRSDLWSDFYYCINSNIITLLPLIASLPMVETGWRCWGHRWPQILGSLDLRSFPLCDVFTLQRLIVLLKVSPWFLISLDHKACTMCFSPFLVVLHLVIFKKYKIIFLQFTKITVKV